MAKLLVLANGTRIAFQHISGRSIFNEMPFEVLVYVNKKDEKYLRDLPDNVEVEVVRWSDPEGVRKRAADAHAKHGLFAVSTPVELLAELAARIRGDLNLPGAKVAEMSRYRDKVEMKRILAEANIRVPRFVECVDRESVYALLKKFKKIVIKPIDGTGAKSVYFIDSIEQLGQWYEKAHNLAEMEAEEFIEGTLYHVNAVVHNGETRFVASAPYLPGMANIDFASGTPFVTVIEPEGDLRNRLQAYSDQVVEALDLQNGVTHMECFVTPNDEIVFCEIGARPGGGGIVWMAEGQYGVQLTRAHILLDAGRGDLIEPQEFHELVGVVGFRAGNALGRVEAAPNAESLREKWVRKADVYLQPGDMMVPSAHCVDFVGVVLFNAKTHEDFIAKYHELSDRFYTSLSVEQM